MSVALAKVTLPRKTETFGYVTGVQRRLEPERRLHAPVDGEIVHLPCLRNPVGLDSGEQRITDTALEVGARKILGLQVHGFDVFNLGHLRVRIGGGASEVAVFPSLKSVVLEGGEGGKKGDGVFERRRRLDSSRLNLVT